MRVPCVQDATRLVVYLSYTETAEGYQLGRTELNRTEKVRRTVDRISLYLQVATRSSGRETKSHSTRSLVPR